jgi:hypothetical protein
MIREEQKVRGEPMASKQLCGPVAKAAFAWGLSMLLAGCSNSAPSDGTLPGISALSAHNTDVTSAPSPVLSTLGADGLAKQHFLDTYIDKTAIEHSYHAHNGDWVDCVDILRQPGMLAPGMAGQPIASPPPSSQMPAPSTPRNVATVAELENHAYAATLDENGSVRQCADQTIPVRRVTAETLAASPSLSAFLSKDHVGTYVHQPPQAPPASSVYVGGAYYMYASDYQFVQNVGIVGNISIWNPYVQKPSSPQFEHSIGQFWMQNNYAELESAETGWMVNPGVFGDYSNPTARLFIGATNNAYTTFAYNLNCNDGAAPCFVQTASGTYFGDSFSNYSTPDGTVYYMYIYYVIYEGNIWLNAFGGFVGYYPGVDFINMSYVGIGGGSQVILWGGEVESIQPAQLWTETTMGSGHPAAQTSYAAWMDNIQYMQSWGTNINTSPTIISSGYDAQCYSVAQGGTDTMYYGGIGWYYDGTCP